MKITNAGRGVHSRELKGVERFKSELPNNWFGFTNLDLVLNAGKAREIDVVIVADHRIFLVDLKDWYGKIDSVDGRWHLNGVEKDSSPVTKITDIARRLAPLLGQDLNKRPETRNHPVPKIEGLVVLTGRADRSGIAETERAKVLTADEFIRIARDEKLQRQTFGNVARQFISTPLTDPFWRDRLGRFFNAGSNSLFRPGKRRFERFVANDVPSFVHPKEIYCEYEAFDEGNKNNLGTLRLWDFTKCPDPRFQAEEGRLEIAGREQKVYHWLRDRSDDIEQVLLTPKIDDSDRGVHYWEIFDRRRRLQRLASFAELEANKLSPFERVELARQLLAALAALHRHDAAHLDIGGHSVWLEPPTTVRLSHLLAAHFPEVRSLGAARYQFLASVGVPEDVLGVGSGPKCRDVFRAGVAIHQILFGIMPQGVPPEWNSAVDTKKEFESLHDWFAEALELDPRKRFSDANTALNAFNRATAVRPTYDEVITGLERFRGEVRSQRQLAASYPAAGEPILESDCVDIWRSGSGPEEVIVKLWKQAAWGDIKREGSSILAFLERVEDVKADRPAGLPEVKAVLWLGDSLAIVQEWIEGTSLALALQEPPEEWRTALGALSVVERLIKTVEELHNTRFGHGDLKPANIIVKSDGELVLIDALDFSPAADGELISSAYAPANGSRFERDRYAVTKIAEEIFALALIDDEDARRLAKAIRDCREKEPALSTLLPLRDEVEAIINKLRSPGPSPADALPSQITISIMGAPAGPIEPDEGFLFMRFRRSPERTLSFVIRGATEEIEVRLDKQGQMRSARRRSLEQRLIRRISAYEFHMIEARLTVDRGDITDLSGLLPILSDPVVRERLEQELSNSEGPKLVDPEESREARLSEEEAEEVLAEEVAAAPLPAGADLVDITILWRALIDVENELTIEGVALQESSYDRSSGRHKVPLNLESGGFDFARNDIVGVLKQDRKGGWRRIGTLDLQSSRSDLAVIEGSDFGSPYQGRLVDEGQRLRFVSHFEVQSLRRRTDAVDRILAGNGRSRDLLSVFDPRSNAKPSQIAHDVDGEALELYELNPDQKLAFRTIVRSRPVGLLQGPPGTGKTRFIAALTHYAITKGLARNVLLSSQSHEAVNTAAEAVLSLFRKTNGELSLLRVAMDEEVVSAPLRPYYTAKVEQGIKDHFRATFRDRLAVIGESLGLPEKVIDEVVSLETNIRPIVARISEIIGNPERDEQRLNGLITTLKRHLEVMELGTLEMPANDEDWSGFADAVAGRLMTRHLHINRINADRIGRLHRAAIIGRDFMGSVSRIQRSFESFLAGTRQIVVGTCVGLGRTSLGLTDTPFDLVIIDEAARCTASELLVPLQAARWAVLVGDQAQLEPHHEAEVINHVAERTGIPKREIMRSDFERVFSTAYGKSAGAKLKTQYRMWRPIGELVSETFYPDLSLIPGRTDPEIDPAVLPPSLDKSLIWVETDSLGEAAFDRREDDGSSRTNKAEVDLILSLLEQWHSHEPFREWLQMQQKHPAGIGIICMYAAQRDLVRRRLRQSPLAYLLDQHVKVGTVDSYQGKQNPIVMLSLVRNNEGGPSEGGLRRIQEGFLVTPNRINVAVSRAMDRLVIIGARKRWPSKGPMGRLVAAYDRQLAAGKASAIDAASVLEREAQDVRPKSAKRSRSSSLTMGGAHDKT